MTTDKKTDKKLSFGCYALAMLLLFVVAPFWLSRLNRGKDCSVVEQQAEIRALAIHLDNPKTSPAPRLVCAEPLPSLPEFLAAIQKDRSVFFFMGMCLAGIVFALAQLLRAGCEIVRFLSLVVAQGRVHDV